MARTTVVVTATVCGLLLIGCDGSGETVAQNLAIATGETQAYAEGIKMCPPDKPHFRGGKCRAPCESGYWMLPSGTCQKNCKAGERRIGDKCAKFEGNVTVSEKTETCKNCHIGRPTNTGCRASIISSCCSCQKNYKIYFQKCKHSILSLKLTEGSYCYSNSYKAETKPPLSSDLKPNCQGISTGLCGRGGYKHCTVKFDTCVWNTAGFPDCTISGNTASCFNTTE